MQFYHAVFDFNFNLNFKRSQSSSQSKIDKYLYVEVEYLGVQKLYMGTGGDRLTNNTALPHMIYMCSLPWQVKSSERDLEEMIQVSPLL